MVPNPPAALDEVAAGRLRRSKHLVVARLRLAVADILKHGAMKQQHILRHDRNRLVQAVLRQLGDVLAVDQHPTRAHFAEALEH